MNFSSIIIWFVVGLLSAVLISYSYLNKPNQKLLGSRSEVATTTTTTSNRGRNCCPYPSSIMEKVKA